MSGNTKFEKKMFTPKLISLVLCVLSLCFGLISIPLEKSEIEKLGWIATASVCFSVLHTTLSVAIAKASCRFTVIEVFSLVLSVGMWMRAFGIVWKLGRLEVPSMWFGVHSTHLLQCIQSCKLAHVPAESTRTSTGDASPKAAN